MAGLHPVYGREVPHFKKALMLEGMVRTLVTGCEGKEPCSLLSDCHQECRHEEILHRSQATVRIKEIHAKHDLPKSPLYEVSMFADFLSLR